MAPQSMLIANMYNPKMHYFFCVVIMSHVGECHLNVLTLQTTKYCDFDGNTQLSSLDIPIIDPARHYGCLGISE